MHKVPKSPRESQVLVFEIQSSLQSLLSRLECRILNRKKTLTARMELLHEDGAAWTGTEPSPRMAYAIFYVSAVFIHLAIQIRQH